VVRVDAVTLEVARNRFATGEPGLAWILDRVGLVVEAVVECGFAVGERAGGGTP
jgi:hypothetical protein